MEVQSVVIPKERFTFKQANRWIKDNGYKLTFYGKPVHLTVGFYRYRQQSPSRFEKESFRTKRLKDNVFLVMGKLKKK